MPVHLDIRKKGVMLRLATERDARFLQDVYASAREEELKDVPLDEAQKAAFVQMQYAQRQADYAKRFPHAVQSVILFRDAPVGALYMDWGPEEARLLSLTILTQRRRRGIGTAVLRAVLQAAGDRGTPLHAALPNGSRAFRLADRLGFERAKQEEMHTRLVWHP